MRQTTGAPCRRVTALLRRFEGAATLVTHCHKSHVALPAIPRPPRIVLTAGHHWRHVRELLILFATFPQLLLGACLLASCLPGSIDLPKHHRLLIAACDIMLNCRMFRSRGQCRVPAAKVPCRAALSSSSSRCLRLTICAGSKSKACTVSVDPLEPM